MNKIIKIIKKTLGQEQDSIADFVLFKEGEKVAISRRRLYRNLQFVLMKLPFF